MKLVHREEKKSENGPEDKDNPKPFRPTVEYPSRTLDPPLVEGFLLARHVPMLPWIAYVRNRLSGMFAMGGKRTLPMATAADREVSKCRYGAGCLLELA
jgi:hypothetical protein